MNVATKEANPKDIVAKGKIPLWLCSPIATAHWALAQFAGMCKYGAWNWRVSGVRSSVYLSAMLRHIHGYLSGEDKDPVDGTHHLGNIMACCAILLDAREAGKLTDDRPPVVSHRGAYAELEALATQLAEQYKDASPRHCSIQDVILPAPPLVPTFGGVKVYTGDHYHQEAPVNAAAIMEAARAVVQNQTVVHTTDPDPEATSSTIPSAPLQRHMTSIPITHTDPDGDPPPSYEAEPDPFPAAPPTLKSDPEANRYAQALGRMARDGQSARIVEVADLAYLVVLRDTNGYQVFERKAEDMPAAHEIVEAFDPFAKDGDTITVTKRGVKVYHEKVCK